MKYLSYEGLNYLYAKIKARLDQKVDKVSGKGLTTNDYTTVDKDKLAGIDKNANNYTHPPNHDATIIIGDAAHRFVTDTEKTTWNGKAGTAVATQSVNGLMAAADKVKIDGVATGANAYVHPATSGNKHIPTGGISGQFLKWSADGTAVWAPDNDTTYVKSTTTIDGLMAKEDKSKLDGIAAGANNYIHPGTHPATMITEDSNHRFTTDVEKTNWNGKANTSVATQSANGLMAAADKTKLDGVSTGANAYTHPSGDGNLHVPTTGTTNSGKVLKAGTTAGSAAWTALTKADVGLNNVDNTSDSQKSVNYANSAGSASAVSWGNVSGKPSTFTAASHTHGAGDVTSDATHRFVTDTEKTTWSGKAGTAVATSTSNGLMASSDKIKLDGVAVGANAYEHPTATGNKHIPSGGAAGQFLKWDSDGTAIWSADNNTTYGKVSTSADGLMAKEDKSKLDGISASANNYVHPATDGNKHVPATGTANNGKVLTAGATEGALSWKALTKAMVELGNVDNTSDANKPVSSAAQVEFNKKYNYISHSAGTYDANVIIQPGYHHFAGPNIKMDNFPDSSVMSGDFDMVVEVGLGGTITQVLVFGNGVYKVRQKLTAGSWTQWDQKELLSNAERIKLQGIETGANKYVHPSSHSASIITPDATHRFVTDSEKSTWNAKIDKTSIVQNATTTDTTKVVGAPVAKNLQDQISEINTNLEGIGNLYTTEEVNTSTLYANNWYDIIGTLTLPPGTYLIVVNLQVTLKEIKIFDNNLNDFYFTQPNSNAISMILSKSNIMKIMIKGMPSTNITLAKSARYNFLQAIRIA